MSLNHCCFSSGKINPLRNIPHANFELPFEIASWFSSLFGTLFIHCLFRPNRKNSIYFCFHRPTTKFQCLSKTCKSLKFAHVAFYQIVRCINFLEWFMFQIGLPDQTFPKTFIHTVNFTALQASVCHGLGFKQWTFHKCRKVKNNSLIYSFHKFLEKIRKCIPAEAHSEPSQLSKKEYFAKIINGWKLSTIFAKNSILDVWQGSEYAFDLDVQLNYDFGS